MSPIGYVCNQRQFERAPPARSTHQLGRDCDSETVAQACVPAALELRGVGTIRAYVSGPHVPARSDDSRSRVELTTAQIRCGWGADETIRSQRAFAARTVDCTGVCSPHLRAYRRERGRHQDLLEPIHFRQPADDGNGGTGLQLHADRIGAAPSYHPFLHHEQARMGRFQHHHRPVERDSHSE